MNKDLFRQLKWFIGIGLVNTGIDFVLFNILLWMFGIKNALMYFVFKSISFIVANINSYFMNSLLTFKEQKNKTSFAQFFLATIIGFIINTSIASLVFYLLKNNMSDVLAANSGIIMGTVVGMAVNFLLYKYVVFIKKHS